MNLQAEALSAAMTRIVTLQAQMTDRVLQMAAEIGKLQEVVSDRQAREFLRVRCNLPSSELTTYVKFAKTLKGSDELLRKARVSFPIVKALVAAAPEAREEILERMEIGARIDGKEITAVSKRLREAKLTPGQIMAERQGKLARSAARRLSDRDAERFKSSLYDFVSEIIDEKDAARICSEEVRSVAEDLRERFEFLFGDDHPALEVIRPRSPTYEVSCAHLALVHLADGTLPTAPGVGAWDPSQRHPWLLSLYALTGRAPSEYPKELSSLRELPAGHHRPTVVELFAGAGGMAVGLENAGYDHVALVEFDTHAAATLRLNRPHWNVIKDDIRSLDFTIYRQLDIDLVSGGPPCQPYSIEGNALGKDDPRDMFPDCVRVVSEIRPKAFIFENVLGLLHAKHADHVAAILRRFKKIGYQTDIHRICASDYGIAQSRSRVLITGMRNDVATTFRMPPRFPDHRANIGDTLLDLMSVNGWDAREWARERREYPVVDRTGSVIAIGAQASTIVTSRGKRRRNDAAMQRAAGLDSTGLPTSAPTAAEASVEGFLPSLTLPMRARLQDFPDGWIFAGGRQASARQIGNAVPPRMASALGLAFASALTGVSWDWQAVLWPEKVRSEIQAPSLAPNDKLLAKSCGELEKA
ncbi:DNA cytosine methyltransferase [Agrobacterium rubi]|nr:DNA (cytosine-5-)-methyltransferase [Agrobacterium rubi]MBP1881614.1 DNA (cytosine-5)-methyltransferase 1 [Agrobacterium rubi]